MRYHFEQQITVLQHSNIDLQSRLDARSEPNQIAMLQHEKRDLEAQLHALQEELEVLRHEHERLSVNQVGTGRKTVEKMAELQRCNQELAVELCRQREMTRRLEEVFHVRMGCGCVCPLALKPPSYTTVRCRPHVWRTPGRDVRRRVGIIKGKEIGSGGVDHKRLLNPPHRTSGVGPVHVLSLCLCAFFFLCRAWDCANAFVWALVCAFGGDHLTWCAPSTTG